MTDKTAPQLLNELVESITQAAGACSQLIHVHQDPRWMTIREMLDLFKEGIVGAATFQASKVSIKRA